MGKKQKSMSLPLDYWEQLKEYYESKKEVLEFIGITSETKLLQVLANFGRTPFERHIAQVSASMHEKYPFK